ncbi:hypothetical protein N752_06870 [Desulforamulus aquiferis]|nr:hypothetical protein [Desulforamulus aquiferis]RYD05962.1 hypothetical protein N752_06870 [Desulforamulus aquiferis]
MGSVIRLQDRRNHHEATPRRVFTPETTFDRYIAMAIERGKLANLVFDDPGKLSTGP